MPGSLRRREMRLRRRAPAHVGGALDRGRPRPRRAFAGRAAIGSGPILAGALPPLPVVTGTLAVFAHREQAHVAAVAALLGAARGTLGLVAFLSVVAVLAPRVSLLAVYLAAAGVTAAVVSGVRRIGPLDPDP